MSFKFFCVKCKTEPLCFTHIGRDDEGENLLVGWHCQNCHRPIVAKASIEYLFDLDVEEDIDWRTVTEEDKEFLRGMRILYEEVEREGV